MTDEMQTCKLILKHIKHHFSKMEMLINHLIGSIHFHSLGICGKADKLYGTDFISGHMVSAAPSQSHI